MYDWCIRAAEKPYATWLMGFISFIESSFFPIPPDTMLVPMSLARPDRAWFYAHVCTLTSVAGGVLGYFIEVPAAKADRLMEANSGFTHRQTMADAMRFSTRELVELLVAESRTGTGLLDTVS